MRICLCLLLSVAWPAAAQSVHKCIDGGGGHSYQSQPCADGEAVRTWAIEVQETSAAKVTQRPATTPPTPRRGSAPVRQGRAPRASTPRRNDQHTRCLAARANQDNALRRLGMQRRYDDLQRLNDRVSAVCNHRGRG